MSHLCTLQFPNDYYKLQPMAQQSALSLYWKIIVFPRWPTVKNVRLAVKLAKERFSCTDLPVLIPLAAQNTPQTRSKFESSLYTKISQRFLQTAHDGSKICTALYIGNTNVQWNTIIKEVLSIRWKYLRWYENIIHNIFVKSKHSNTRGKYRANSATLGQGIISTPIMFFSY